MRHQPKKEGSYSIGQKLKICAPILIPIVCYFAEKYEAQSYNEAGLYKMAEVFWPIYVPVLMLLVALTMEKDRY